MIKKIFPILALSIFASMLGAGIVAPLLPLYANSLGASGIGIGIIFASFSISRTIFMPFAGWLSDRRGRKLFLTIGLLCESLISLGYVWAGTTSQLVLVRLINGATAGMIIPIAQAYVGDASPPGEEGAWMGYFNAAFFTGFGFGPLMGGALTDHFGMSVCFYAMGGLNLLAFLIVAFLLPESRQRKKAGSILPSIRELNSSGMVKGLFCFQVAFALGRGVFTAFLPIFASLYVGLSPTLIGVLVAVNILLMSLLQVCGGHFADRLNRKAMVTIGGLINLAFLALIPLGSNFWQLLGICVIGSLGGAVAIPAASALTVEAGRRYGMGSTVAILAMAFSVGFALGPLLSGFITELANISSAFYFGAIMTLAGTALFIRLTRGHGGTTGNNAAYYEITGQP